MGRRATVPVTLHLTARDAQHLRVNSGHNFLADQSDRFEVSEDRDPFDPRWAGGTMTWCHTASDALLLRAYEHAAGADAMLLFDCCMPDGDVYVVLSTRCFDCLL